MAYEVHVGELHTASCKPDPVCCNGCDAARWQWLPTSALSATMRLAVLVVPSSLEMELVLTFGSHPNICL